MRREHPTPSCWFGRVAKTLAVLLSGCRLGLPQRPPNPKRAPQVKSSRAQTQSRVHALPKLVFETGQKLTSYAGLVVFQGLFKRLELKMRLRRHIKPAHDEGSYGMVRVVLALLVHLLLGFRRLREVEYYREDPLVCRVVGVKKMPSSSTLSRNLGKATAETVEGMRNLNRELVLERLAAEKLDVVTLDFDGSQLSTKGHKEGTAVGFNKTKKGARSFFPLFGTVAQTHQFLDHLHRPGNAHDSRDAEPFIRGCLKEVQRALPKAKREVRLDAAFFSDEIIGSLSRSGVEFSASVPFHRWNRLKLWIQERSRWRSIDGEWSYFEKRWKPESWNQTYRFIFVRQKKRKMTKEPLQLDLFDPENVEFSYSVIITNKTGHAKRVIAFHHGRGAQEKLFGEAKQDCALDVIPAKRLVANQLFTATAIFAHTLSQELQMTTKTKRKANHKHTAIFSFQRLSTLRRTIIHRAGRLVRPEGQLQLKLNANQHVEREIRNHLKALGVPH